MNQQKKTSFWGTPNGIAAIIFIGFVAYFLFMEHRQHLFQALPFLIILLCPLMHFFMHKNHGHKDHDRPSHDQKDDEGDR